MTNGHYCARMASEREIDRSDHPEEDRDDFRADLLDAEHSGDLVRRLHAGDVTAFDDLYEVFWTPLYNFAFHYLHSAEEAEDVVQEVFFRIWRDRADWNV